VYAEEERRGSSKSLDDISGPETVDASFFRGARGLTNFERAFGDLYSALFAYANARYGLTKLNYQSDEDILRWAQIQQDLGKKSAAVAAAIVGFEKMISGIRSRPSQRVTDVTARADGVEDAIREIAVADITFIHSQTGGGNARGAVTADRLIDALKAVVEMNTQTQQTVTDLLSGTDGLLDAIRDAFTNNIYARSVNSVRTYHNKKVGQAKQLGIALDKAYKADRDAERKSRQSERRDRR